MTFYKKTIMIALLCIPLYTFGNIGIGLSTFNYDSGNYYENNYSSSEILIPIQISNSFRLEPSLRYSAYKTTDEITVEEYEYEYKSEVIDIALGIFYTSQIKKKFTFYIGPRIGYISYNASRTYTYAYDNDIYSDEYPSSGYTFSPSLGLEYEFFDNFRIGGELSVRYEKIFGDLNESYNGEEEDTGDNNDESTTTVAKFILRYFF